MNTETSHANEQLVRQAFAGLNAGDLDACVELLTPDFIANFPSVPTPQHGRDAWRQGVQGMLDAFPDLRVQIEDIFAGRDRVAVRLGFSGTHAGAFQGVPPTGRAVAFTSVEIYRIAGGKIAEEWVSPDIATLMRQITQ